MENHLFSPPEYVDIAMLVADDEACFLHEMGKYARLANEGLSSEEVMSWISLAALGTLKIFIPLVLGAEYTRNFRERRLVEELLDPMRHMLDLVQGRHFDPSLVQYRERVVKIADKMLLAYSNLREYYQTEMPGL